MITVVSSPPEYARTTLSFPDFLVVFFAAALTAVFAFETVSFALSATISVTFFHA